MRAENATSVVDGNAAAGILSEVFAGDVTLLTRRVRRVRGGRAARPRRSSSSTTSAAIVRCRGCTHTLVTVLRDGARRAGRDRSAAGTRGGACAVSPAGA